MASSFFCLPASACRWRLPLLPLRQLLLCLLPLLLRLRVVVVVLLGVLLPLLLGVLLRLPLLPLVKLGLHKPRSKSGQTLERLHVTMIGALLCPIRAPRTQPAGLS